MLSELETLHRLHFENKFPFPDLSTNVKYISTKRDKHDEIITMGLIKNFYEVIFLTDLTKDKSTRMKGVVDVSNELKSYLDAIKAEQVHCFVSLEDKKFAKLLVDKFGFQLVRDIPLVRNL